MVWVEVEVDGIIIFMVSWVGVDLISYFDIVILVMLFVV